MNIIWPTWNYNCIRVNKLNSCFIWALVLFVLLNTLLWPDWTIASTFIVVLAPLCLSVILSRVIVVPLCHFVAILQYLGVIPSFSTASILLFEVIFASLRLFSNPTMGTENEKVLSIAPQSRGKWETIELNNYWKMDFESWKVESIKEGKSRFMSWILATLLEETKSIYHSTLQHQNVFFLFHSM